MDQDKPDADQLEAMICATIIRSALESMHVRGAIAQSDMRELNTTVRDSCYTFLKLLRESRAGDEQSIAALASWARLIDPDWELPKAVEFGSISNGLPGRM